MLEELQTDKDGYVILDKEEVWATKQDGGIEVMEIFNFDDIEYYFKKLSIGSIRGKYQRMEEMAEVVNGKLYPRFGLDSVQYRLARRKKDFGVISQDFKQKSPRAKTLYDYLKINKIKNYSMTLASLKRFDFIKNKPKDFLDKLDMVSLVHAGLGQEDGHFDNIAVYRKSGLENFILFDNSICVPTSIKTVTNGIPDDYFVDVRFGIDRQDTSFADYLRDLSKSPNISSNSIRKYLDNLQVVLTNGVLKSIQEEVVEENKILSSSETIVHLNQYVDNLGDVMERNGEKFQKCYDMRTAELGE